MEMMESVWNGFKRLDFQFLGHNAILVVPNKPREDKKWIYKTEYFEAFPTFEIEMVQRGYYLAYWKGTTRWCPLEDTDMRKEFCLFLQKEFDLYPKCLTVGMSCGGMQAIYLAAKYPEVVGAMYLDAPVVNLLSCPCGVGLAENKLYEEFKNAMHMTITDVINFRNHPYDHLEELIGHKIPLALVCGDSDKTVPYVENGIEISKAYRKTNIPFYEVLKEGCDHHPHGLSDVTPLISFFENNY